MSPLLALSGHSNRAHVCPLLDQSGQEWILARVGLSANDPKRTLGCSSGLDFQVTTISSCRSIAISLVSTMGYAFVSGASATSTRARREDASGCESKTSSGDKLSLR